MSVSIKPNDNGEIVTAYEGNPEFGYVVLHSVETVFQGQWMKETERSTIMKGEVAKLAKIFKASWTAPNGKIAVTECLEDEVPPKLEAMFFNKDLDHEENIKPYLKTAGEGGPQLLSGGKRILRFTEFDPAGQQADVRVQHDNGDEVKAYNASQKAKGAKLPE